MYLNIELLQEMAHMGNEEEEEDLDKETVGRKVEKIWYLKTFEH